MSWTALPSELRIKIIRNLGRDDWKNWRLTNKSQGPLAELALFETVHLTPNALSFDRARNIASSHVLRQHVRRVVYHLGILEDVHNGFQMFRDDIIRLHKPVGSIEKITEDILWKYSCFLEEMEGQSDFEKRDASQELKGLLERFQYLESITTVLDENDPFTPPSDYIGRRTGMHCVCSAEGHHFSNLLNAAAKRRLKSIRGWSMSWRCLPRIADVALIVTDLSNLNELAIGLFNSEYEDLNSEDAETALRCLDKFLSMSVTTRLRSLQLDFDEIVHNEDDSRQHSISKVVLKHSWPALEDLALQGVSVEENELIDFFGRHSSCLKSLHLDDLRLLDDVSTDPDGETETVPGSIIVLFNWISENMRLDLVSLSGNFASRNHQVWYVDLDHDFENCARRRIELWMCRRGPAPFDDVDIHGPRPSEESIWAELQKADVMVCGQFEPFQRPYTQIEDASWVWDGLD